MVVVRGQTARWGTYTECLWGVGCLAEQTKSANVFMSVWIIKCIYWLAGGTSGSALSLAKIKCPFPMTLSLLAPSLMTR